MPIKKIVLILFFLIIFIALPHQNQTKALDVSSDAYDKITKELSDLKDALEKSQAATKPLQSELDRMQKQINGIKEQVVFVEKDTAVKKKEIEKGYDNLARKQQLVQHTIKQFYMKSYTQTPLTAFLAEVQGDSAAKEELYQEIKTRQDKAVITNIALSITELENKKQKLEQEQKWLIATKSTLDIQSARLDEVIKGALSYQKDVSAKIQELSAQQQAIINARSGNFTFSIGDGELADEYLSSIKGFRESAPSGYFAVFSFGAYTHRNGMSQYGARARAEGGQSVEDILKAYYPGAELKKDFAVMDNISVDGHGSIPFEGQYLQGIYEMPGSWHINALKAQAIAARTYAIRYTDRGQKSICTTEACQVFRNERKGGAWEQAVNETKGWVLVDGGGNPVSTQYASTHGGFTNQKGWDTTDGSGGSNFIDKSYEKLGGSPWLYKAWWREGYSNSSSTCGRANPWLSPQELADIANAAIALRTPGIDTSRITPITTSCWNGNPYSIDELRSLTSSHGGISAASSVSVSQGNGETTNVTINGISMSGSEFKKAYALRAPGYLRIPQTGFTFFNIEKK